MVLSAKVEVRGSAISGRGIFVIAPISKGEWVWKEDPDEELKYWKTAAQVAELSDEDRKYFLNFAYVVKPGVYSGCLPGQETDGGEFMNHSCDPSAAPVGGDAVYVALRDLSPGDEVTYDYCCTETTESSHTPFECRCGHGACRGTVTGLDCVNPVLIARYADCFSSTVRAFQAEHAAAASAASS